MSATVRRSGIAIASGLVLLALLAPALSSGGVPAGRTKGSSTVRQTTRYFGVLRRAHRPVDRLPQDRRAYWRQFKSKYGLAIGGARRTLDSHRGTVWLIPGAGWLCMDVLDKPIDVVIGGCQPLDKARRGLISLTQKFKNRGLLITGAVPDGTRHLRVVNSHHRPTPVPISRNTYRVRFSGDQAKRWRPRRIVFLVAGHRHSFKLAGIRHPGA
jgi:hypothetical protein